MTMRSVAQGGCLSVGEDAGVRQAKLAFGCFAALLIGLIGVCVQRNLDQRQDTDEANSRPVHVAAEPQHPAPGVLKASLAGPISGAGTTVVPKTADSRTLSLQQPSRMYDSVAHAPPVVVGTRWSASGEAGHDSLAGRQPATPAPETPDMRAQGAPAQTAPAPTLALAVPRSVRVLSPLSFSVGSTHYRLQSADGLGVSPCSSKRAGRCFRRPRGDLKEAIAGATLQCRTLDRRDGEILVACSKGTLSSLR